MVNGHLSEVLKSRGYNVRSSDYVDRGYGDEIIDFLKCSEDWYGDILTNPPYKFAEDFVYKAISLINNNNYVIMFLKIQFLEGKSRYKLFKKYPPKYIYVHSSRQQCFPNGKQDNKGSAVCYCWYVWQKGFNSDPVIRWIE